MTGADLDDVVRAEYEKPAWSRALFEGELHHPQGRQFVAFVLETGQFAGYLCCRTVLDEAEIIRIAVVPGFRRQGIADLLLKTAISRMKEDGAARCFLEVRQSNGAARGLYGKHSFRHIGVRRKYYVSPAEDALIFKLDLTGKEIEKEQR